MQRRPRISNRGIAFSFADVPQSPHSTSRTGEQAPHSKTTRFVVMISGLHFQRLPPLIRSGLLSNYFHWLKVWFSALGILPLPSSVPNIAYSMSQVPWFFASVLRQALDAVVIHQKTPFEVDLAWHSDSLSPLAASWLEPPMEDGLPEIDSKPNLPCRCPIP